MDRAYASGSSGSAPAALTSPSVGYPTGGNPGTGTPATKPGPWWYHMITEELRGVITTAGLTPDHANVGQLVIAIQRLITGGDFKDSVRVATTANIPLSGTLTIDGVVTVAGDRVLAKDQSAASQNGIYVVASGAWSRAIDADTGSELSAGATIPVEEGTSNADTQWTLTTDGAITIGTTAIAFAKRDVADASTTVKGKVQLATATEAQALTDVLKPITPATLAGAFQGGNQTLSGNGYQKLPGGLILQWVSALVSGSSNLTVNWPIAFPTSCFAATSLQLSSFINHASPTTTSINVQNAYGSALNVWLIAIGK
jgi:phage-related tail fiber protein